MLEITKNGFYKMSELISSFSIKGSTKVRGDGLGIVILDNLKIAIYDDTISLFKREYPKGEGLEPVTKIIIGENSNLEYFIFFSEEGINNRHFVLGKENSKASIKSLIYSENNKIESEIKGEIADNNSEINLDILSFAGENGKIKLDGILQINEELKGVKGRLDEENIFLGETGNISGVPTLLVATNEVEASHSCKMEKISDEKLFYLRSRGIDKKNALKIMIEAKIKNLYRCLSMYDNKFYEEVLEKILEKIK